MNCIIYIYFKCSIVKDKQHLILFLTCLVTTNLKFTLYPEGKMKNKTKQTTSGLNELLFATSVSEFSVFTEKNEDL